MKLRGRIREGALSALVTPRPPAHTTLKPLVDMPMRGSSGAVWVRFPVAALVTNEDEQR
jgi:hypothetical protein